MKPYVDFYKVDDIHVSIHRRLLNWASWVQVHFPSAVCPYLKAYQSKSRQWHTPEYRDTCDVLDAMAMEKEVAKLEEKSRFAIRWVYVYQYHPRKAMRKIGVSGDGLSSLIRSGRQALLNGAA